MTWHTTVANIKPCDTGMTKPLETGDDLACHSGDDGLCVYKVGVAQVVEAARGEDLRARLEPGGLFKGHVTVLGQQLGGEAAQRAQHGPAGVDHLCLTVPGCPQHHIHYEYLHNWRNIILT